MVFGLFRRQKKAEQDELIAGSQSEDVAHTSIGGPLDQPSSGDDLVVATRSEELGPMLWQNVAYGMPMSEICALRPDATTSTSPRLLGDGTPCELEIPHLNLAGHDYSVLFYFRAGRLLQVMISTNGGPSLADFRSIANALRIRYGDASEYKEDPGGISTGEWLSQEGANVSIICFPEADVLNINFQCRYLSAAAQL